MRHGRKPRNMPGRWLRKGGQRVIFGRLIRGGVASDRLFQEEDLAEPVDRASRDG